ncbi:uncharacterized protein LOC144434848 [Glandiceps talaboti]
MGDDWLKRGVSLCPLSVLVLTTVSFASDFKGNESSSYLMSAKNENDPPTRDSQGFYGLKEVYVNPQTVEGSLQCGRSGNVSWICDPNGVLTVEEADTLENDLDEIRRLTACVCKRCTSNTIPVPDGEGEFAGFIVGVALLKKMIPTLKTKKEQTQDDLQLEAKRWAAYLLDDWRLGDCGNDAILFVSVDDNAIYTATGETTGSILTVPVLTNIHKENKHYFDSEDYYTGLEMIIRDYNHTLLAGIQEPLLSSIAIYGIVFLSMAVPLLGFVIIHSICTTRDGKTFICTLKKNRSDSPVYVAASV